MNLKDEIQKLDGPIAIFGAGGFIGTNLFRSVFAERNDVYAVTHQPFTPWRLLGVPRQNVLQCDITRPQSVAKLFERLPFRTIFCFAAYGAYARQSDAIKIYQTNLIGLLNIIEVSKKHGISALVHAGSSSEYGLNCETPKEEAELEPNSHYAVSKVSAAYLLKYLGKQQGFPAINLRLYSAYGPWEESDRLVPNLIEHGLNGTLPTLVEPEISRDFIYVDDVVHAALLAATIGVKQAPGASLNIGTGKRTTLREIVKTNSALFKIEQEPIWGTMPNRAWDLRSWYADPAAAEKILGWKAVTSLSDGLAKTRLWREANGPLPKMVPSLASDAPPRLSAVVACYRDGEAIPVMHQRLTEVFQKLSVDYEIIFVNDASPDDSDSVLSEICERDPHVIALEHSRNFGSQNAFLDGMAVSTGDAVVLLDGDLQDPPEMIEAFFQKWMEGYEVVYGRRIKRETTLVLQFCYKIFYRLLRKLAYIPIPVDAGDFSLMDRKVIDQILKLPETDQFLRGLRAWVGFKQIGVDYIRPERMFGVSTNNWLKNFWWARKAIFNFSFAPMSLMLFGGMGLTLLAFFALISQIVMRFIDPTIPHGISTIIVLILFFGGINMLGLSVLGEYLGKIFEETKQRPKYIRRSIRFASQHFKTAGAMDKFLSQRNSVVGPSGAET